MKDNSLAIVLKPTEVIKQTFQSALLKAKRDEALSGLTITATFQGRVDGEMKLEYSVCDCSYGGGGTTGHITSHNLDAAIDELLRRRGFAKVNTPLMISASDQPTEQDIAF